MASKKSRAQSEVPQFLVIDEGVRENLARRFLEFQQRKAKKTQEKNATLQQMAKYLGEIHGEVKPPSSDPKTAKALKGLLGIHEKLANQKLAPPQVPLGTGGINYTVTVTPPYDYYPKPSTTVDTGALEPILTGSPDPTTGQLSSSAVTLSQPGYNGGEIYVTLGIYFPFVPPVAGTLTAYANPIYSYECWTESYFPPNSPAPLAKARSFLSGSLNIYGTIPNDPPPTFETTASKVFFQLDQTTPTPQTPGPLAFEDGFNLQTSVSVSTPVDPSQAYMIFISVETLVNGFGSLGSIAGAMLSVTIPSITYNFISPAGPIGPLPGR